MMSKMFLSKNDSNEKREKLRIFLEEIKKGKHRYPEYDYEAYKKMKAMDREKSLKLIKGEYE